MTFTNFFNLLLKRRFIDLLKQNEKDFNYQILTEDVDSYGIFVLNEEEEKYDIDLSKMSEFEKIIYQKYFIEEKSISDIAVEMNLTEKQVYSARSRVKSKLKNK